MIITLSACNISRVVKPLEKGEHQLSASLGGPAIVFSGAPVPLPLSSIAYAYGLDSGLSVSAGLHTTSMLFGVAQADASLHAELWRNESDRFGLIASPGAVFIHEFYEGNSRIYPQLDLGSWWHYKKENPNHLYGGVGTWVELFREKAHGEVQDNELMPYVTLGHKWVKNRWALQLEARYIGMFSRNDQIVVDYLTPLNVGTTGVYFGFTKTIGK